MTGSAAAEPTPATEPEPAAGGSLAQLREVLGADVATGFDGFTAAIDYLKPRALEHGFALVIKTATGSAKPSVRGLESGPHSDVDALQQQNKYGLLTLVCSRTGGAVSEGGGVRASSTGKCNCPFIINMSRVVNKGRDQPNPVNINCHASDFSHTHSMLKADEAKLLRPARFIPADLQASLARLARSPGLSEGRIYELLVVEAGEKNLALTWTLEDVRQALYEARGNHATCDAQKAVEILAQLAADGRATYQVTSSEGGHLQRIVWQTERQVRA